MEEAVLKRVLPHSLEAEQSVIGSMLMDREAIVVASELIYGEDFYNKQYGVVFDAMVELNDQGSPVDLVTLQNRLREKDVPPEVSSLEFIGELIRAVPTSANIKYYANIVAEKSTLRKLIRLNEEIANNCYAGKESLEFILEDTEKRIFQLVQKRNTADFVPIRQVVMNAMDKIESAARNKGAVTGIPTGFIDLDYRTAGMQPREIRRAFRHSSKSVRIRLLLTHRNMLWRYPVNASSALSVTTAIRACGLMLRSSVTTLKPRTPAIPSPTIIRSE